MMEYALDTDTAVLHVRPTGPLQQQDFDQLAELVDPYIEQCGGLHGLLIETRKFPGWEDLGVAIRHFRFVRDHHRKIKRVAIVTDSRLGEAAEHIASHFVAATIRHFPSTQTDEANTWVASD